MIRSRTKTILFEQVFILCPIRELRLTYLYEFITHYLSVIKKHHNLQNHARVSVFLVLSKSFYYTHIGICHSKPFTIFHIKHFFASVPSYSNKVIVDHGAIYTILPTQYESAG